MQKLVHMGAADPHLNSSGNLDFWCIIHLKSLLVHWWAIIHWKYSALPHCHQYSGTTTQACLIHILTFADIREMVSKAKSLTLLVVETHTYALSRIISSGSFTFTPTMHHTPHQLPAFLEHSIMSQLLTLWKISARLRPRLLAFKYACPGHRRYYPSPASRWFGRHPSHWPLALWKNTSTPSYPSCSTYAQD